MFSSDNYFCDLRAVGILIKSNKILVQCDKDGNEYALPGGHIKIGETLEDGLIREYKDDKLLKFAVIISKTNGKWVLCKHKERDTYEVPGGHQEENETIFETAKRELSEETGAVDFTIMPICVYSVKGKARVSENVDVETFGMLFYAQINEFEEIHSEIDKILITDNLNVNWTYPLIQPKLIEEARRRGVA